jgi:nickel-type superoxide dismutase maturation protease
MSAVKRRLRGMRKNSSDVRLQPMGLSDIFRNPFRLGTVAVAGDSMSPTYRPGDWLLVRWASRFNVGDVVVIEREERPGVFLIKRYLREVEGLCWVEGDSDASTDSREWGAIPSQEIVAKVLFRIRRNSEII